jgi:hypothetical protein
LNLGRLSAGGARVGDVASSFGDASRGVARHVERPRPHSTMSMALGRSYRRPLRVEGMSPPSVGFVVARVPHVPFGLCAFLLVLLVCQGLFTRALLPQRGGGAVLVADGVQPRHHWLILNRTGLELASERRH